MKIRKDQELIPPEKRKQIIYIERRGRRKMHISAVSAAFLALGILCILYCLFIFFFMGYGTRFFLIWGAIGVCFLGMSWLTEHREWAGAVPGWLKTAAGVLVGLGVLLFIVVEGFILSRFGAKAPGGADYCVILGAQMKEQGPSDVLRRRLDRGIAYLEKNPETAVIVSGGQGSNEPVSEARGMYDYLTEKGIDPDRIILEDASSNTWENLKFSSELLDQENDAVVIITNNFHVFRAECIAKKLGYENAWGLAADSFPLMVPNNMLREFFGVVKDLLVGNMQ